jgi:hypothetical protein
VGAGDGSKRVEGKGLEAIGGVAAVEMQLFACIGWRSFLRKIQIRHVEHFWGVDYCCRPSNVRETNMRYLKITAQDRSGNRRADTVLLHFFETIEDSADQLIHKAYALDITADGKVDFQVGDVNNDGKENTRDERLLKKFADAYLQLNWFNPGDTWARYLKIFVEDFAQDGSPDTVRLHFHEGTGESTDESIVYTASAYDTNNDGKLDWLVHFDVDNDGDTDAVDQKLVTLLSNEYLKFKWK